MPEWPTAPTKRKPMEESEDESTEEWDEDDAPLEELLEGLTEELRELGASLKQSLAKVISLLQPPTLLGPSTPSPSPSLPIKEAGLPTRSR